MNAYRAVNDLVSNIILNVECGGVVQNDRKTEMARAA